MTKLVHLPTILLTLSVKYLLKCNKKAMGPDRFKMLTKSGSNYTWFYAKHYVGVGHAQPHEYHHIPAYQLKGVAKTFSVFF